MQQNLVPNLESEEIKAWAPLISTYGPEIAHCMNKSSPR